MKTLHRIPYTANNLVFHVIHSMKKIHKTFLRMICHGIDRKISSLQILLKAGSKGYLLRMPAILIIAVHPIGGDLISLLVHHHRNRTMLKTGIYRSWKQFLHLIR